MHLKPVGNHLVLKPVDQETTTASGIIIPETVDKERPEKGEVLAVGPGKIQENGQRAPIDVTVGQTVIFKKYAPDEFEIDGKKFLIITAEDVMAVIE